MLPNDNISVSVWHLDHVLTVYSSMEHVTWKCGWVGRILRPDSCLSVSCLFDPMCLFYTSDKRGTLDQEDTDNFYAWDMQGIWPVDMLYFTRRPHVTNFHKIWFNSMCLRCNHIFYISWLTAFASVRVTFHSFSKRSEVVKTMLHYGTYSDVTVFFIVVISGLHH